jgi:hypothetical protein
MKGWHSLLLFGVLAVLLLVADRYYRIGSYMRSEGFQNPQKCGLDMPPCAYPNVCANGWCIPSGVNPLGERNPLPVV